MNGVSKTAVFVAAARAVGAREPDAKARNPDFLAEKLLDDPALTGLDLSVVQALQQDYALAMQDVEIASTVRAMNVRAHFIDEALERSLTEGARQLLVLGAGFDSHAYRFAERLRGLSVFEVDHPATQTTKMERVRAAVGRLPEYLRYVPIDLEKEDLREVLERAGYDFAKKTFVIMEGLTMYLDEASLRATFGVLATNAPGTRVVFDFVTNVMVTALMNADLESGPLSEQQSLKRFLEIIRGEERWEFGFPFRGEREYIEALGLQVAEILNIGSDEAAERYLMKADGTQVGAEGLARAPQPPPGAEAQREAMAYRIAEVVVPLRH